MVKTFKHGDHVCALYSDDNEQLAIAADYIAEGLRNGERCLYVTGSAAGLKRFRQTLAGTGVNVGKMAKTGALLEATNLEAHLSGGRFDSERMLQMLNDAVEDALNAGFQGLRTCGDMSWLLDEPDGWEQVVEYEALLNQFFQGVRAIGICLYDRSRLPLARIDDALATHTTVYFEGRHLLSPFYEAPALSIGRRSNPQAVAGKLEVLRQRQ